MCSASPAEVDIADSRQGEITCLWVISDPFACLPNQLIDHRIQVSRPLIGCQLAVCTRPLLENAIGVLDFFATAKLIDDITNEPLDHLANEVTGWEFFLFTEIDELAIQSVAHGPPFVLFDQVGRIDTKGHVVTAQLP